RIGAGPMDRTAASGARGVMAGSDFGARAGTAGPGSLKAIPAGRSDAAVRRRYHSICPASHAIHTTHASMSAVEKCPTTVRFDIRAPLLQPGKVRAAAERVFLQQRVEDRCAGALALHRRAQRLLEIGLIVTLEHENDDHAALVRRIAHPRPWRRVADVQPAAGDG